MKAKLSQNEKLKSINDLKDELLKNLRGSQQQKPKTNQRNLNNLNNSSISNKFSNPLKTGSPGTSILIDKINIQPTQKKNSSVQQNIKGNYNTTVNKKSVELTEELNVTTSTIDEVINSNDDNIKNLEDSKKVFNDQFSSTFLENLPNETSELQRHAREIISELFKLQGEYYKSFNKEMITNTKLKELLVLYNQKYRVQLKKSNLIKDGFESNNIKNTLTLTINREEGSRFKDMVNSNKSELKIFQKILNVNYKEEELKAFKDENQLNNETQEKTLLLKSLEKLVSDPISFSKIPQTKRLAIETICTKYNISLPESNVEDENNIINDNNKDTEVKNSEEKKTEEIDTEEKKETIDKLESELREFLVQFYLKKKVSVIPFYRLGPGLYEYGTQKIVIKKENETLKVKVGNSYILLERFIELNANTEEYKLMKFSKKTSISDSKRGSTMAQRGSALKTPTK